MKRFYLDTEFIDPGGDAIYPISVGIVCEDGREFYGELADEAIPWDKADDWVLRNVRPLLDRNPATTYRTKREMADAINVFVREGGDVPQFWAYFGDWDWVVLIHLFGRMLDTPPGWPMMCMDLKQWAVMMGDPSLPAQKGAQHNALDDARWNKRVWDFLYLHSKGSGWRV